MRKLIFAMLATCFAGSAFAWQDEAIKRIKQEDIVSDAAVVGPYSLWVAVKSDGSSRDGLAEYMCLLIDNKDMVIIRIVNLADFDETLGRTECEAK